jgi:hypothetical protein
MYFFEDGLMKTRKTKKNEVQWCQVEQVNINVRSKTMKPISYVQKWVMCCVVSVSLLSVAAQADTNVALGKPATASSVGYSLQPSNAVDGNIATRWTSGKATESWIRVDLGSKYVLSQVILRWENGYSKSYQIELSNDDATWVSAYSTTAGDGGVDTIDINGGAFGPARYVRMKSTIAYNSNWGVSLWEFEIYGVPDPTPVVAISQKLDMVKLPVNSLSVDAAVTDIDSTSFTYAWTQVSGPALAGFGGTAAQEDPTITFPSVRGWYVFQVVVTDESSHVSDPAQIQVRVWDPAADEVMVAHWAFSEGTGTVVNDTTSDNDKGLFGHYQGTNPHYDPNWVPGWIPADGAGNYALDFYDLGYVEATPDPNAVNDPNLTSLDMGLTVAGWVNAVDWSGNRRIIQYGDLAGDTQNIFRLLCESGSIKFIPDISKSGYTSRQAVTAIFPAAEWHHVAGTYDGKVVKLYIDGVLSAAQEYAAFLPLQPHTNQTLFIGCKNKLIAEQYAGDYMKGRLDDIRVYSYALDSAAIRSLVQMGQNAAPSIVGFNVPDVVMLTGTAVIDVDTEVFDANGDGLAYAWTQISPADPVAVFSAMNVEDPQITFTTPGVYRFRLTMNDGQYGTSGNIYKEFTITVNQADCARVKADGLLMAGDINEDCRVDINDFALMAADWLKCNNPVDSACVNPYL